MLAVVVMGAWGSGPSYAQDVQDYVYRQYKKIYAQRIDEFLRVDRSRTHQEKHEIVKFYRETKRRIQTMESVRSQGMNYQAPLLEYLKTDALPKLEQIVRAHGIKVEEYPREPKFSVRSGRLSKLFENIAYRSGNKLRFVVVLNAFLRSETVSDGRIGEWSPQAADAIQRNAQNALRRIITEITQGDWSEKPVDFNVLKYIHGILLGNSGHEFSKPGQANNFHFVEEGGRRVHVSEYIRRWEANMRNGEPKLSTAVRAYLEFLHIHPMGDSNGRLAEVAKQALLRKYNLPPLLTFEKTSIENFAYQEVFGSSSLHRVTHSMVEETIGFLEFLDAVLPAKGKVTYVDFSGSNIALQVEVNGKTEIIVITRVTEIPLSAELPPIRGNLVVAGVSAEEAKLRVTKDRWKTFEDLVPMRVYRPQRMGEAKLVYNSYRITKLPSHNLSEMALSFSQFYPHPNGNVVWLNNHGHNFNLFFPKGGNCQHLHRFR